MKVHVKTDDANDFKSYTVAITITTKKESTYFHDHVMPVLSRETGGNPVYGAIFHAGQGDEVDVQGEI